MTQYKRIGIDTSKAVFTLHGVDQHDRPVLRINLRRAQMIRKRLVGATLRRGSVMPDVGAWTASRRRWSRTAR